MTDDDKPTYDREKILLAVARLIWKEGIKLGQFYEAVGVDLMNADPDATAELSGILTGWNHPPDDEE